MEGKEVSLVGKGILNYLKSLKYYFIPIGCFSLVVVLGLSTIIPIIYKQLTTFGSELASIVQESVTTFNIEDTISYVVNDVTSLDWSSNQGKALETVTNSTYIQNLVINSLKAGIKDFSQVESHIIDLITKTSKGIVNSIFSFISFLYFGLLLGFMITKFQIRRNIAQRKFWKLFLINFVDSLINATIVSGVIYLLSLWKVTIFISIPLLLILYAFINLFEAYIVQGYKKVELKEVLKFVNVLKLILTSLCIILIAAAFSALSIFITKWVAGIFISLPFIVIALIVNSLNAEAYVKDVVESKATS